MIPHHPFYLSAVQLEHIHPAMRNDSSWMATCHSGAPSSNITPDVWQFCHSAISRRPASGSPANSVSSVWRSLCPPELSPVAPTDTLHWCSLKETQECVRTRCPVLSNTLCCNEKQLAHHWQSSGLGPRLSGFCAEPPPGWYPPTLRWAPRQLAVRRGRARTPLLHMRGYLGKETAEDQALVEEHALFYPRECELPGWLRPLRRRRCFLCVKKYSGNYSSHLPKQRQPQDALVRQW